MGDKHLNLMLFAERTRSGGLPTLAEVRVCRPALSRVLKYHTDTQCTHWSAPSHTRIIQGLGQDFIIRLLRSGISTDGIKLI